MDAYGFGKNRLRRDGEAAIRVGHSTLDNKAVFITREKTCCVGCVRGEGEGKDNEKTELALTRGEQLEGGISLDHHD